MIYFYSKNGQHKTASLYAVTALMLEFQLKKSLVDQCICVRGKFEELLRDNEYLVQQIWRQYRTSSKAYEHIKEFYLQIISKLTSGKTIEATINEILKDPRFDYLARQEQEHNGRPGEDFSRETKSAAFIREALQRAIQCRICQGLIHINSTSFDHIERKSEGGNNSIINAQLTHPYCNTGFKH